MLQFQYLYSATELFLVMSTSQEQSSVQMEVISLNLCNAVNLTFALVTDITDMLLQTVDGSTLRMSDSVVKCSGLSTCQFDNIFITFF